MNWDLEKFPKLAEPHDNQDVRDKLGPDQKMRILEQVAAAMHGGRTGLECNIISKEALRDVIERELAQLDVKQTWKVADDLISLLRERNFIFAYVGDNQYAFVHRTFLEYFCARDLKYRLEKTSAASIEDVQPVVGAMRQKLLVGTYIQADETPVDVQMEDKRGHNHQAYLWQYGTPRRCDGLRFSHEPRPRRPGAVSGSVRGNSANR